MRATVYVDGLNLYYGLARPLDCKWVDLYSLFAKSFPDDEITCVHFFEAFVVGDGRSRQEKYFDALRQNEKVKVHVGKMLKKQRVCRVNACRHPKSQREFSEYEEKYTDVAIGARLVADALATDAEKLILVTADTDLLPAVELVRSLAPSRQIRLVLPSLHINRILGAEPLGRAVHKTSRLSPDRFLECQFPEVVNSIVRPNAWREAPRDAFAQWRAAHPNEWATTLPRWTVEPEFRPES